MVLPKNPCFVSSRSLRTHFQVYEPQKAPEVFSNFALVYYEVLYKPHGIVTKNFQGLELGCIRAFLHLLPMEIGHSPI